MVTPEQIRAARAFLDWGQEELAVRAELSSRTVMHFEKGKCFVKRGSVLAMQQALEEGGVEFTPDGGVRPRASR
jgi:transcriptional regulator with XRE-family HTH domain